MGRGGVMVLRVGKKAGIIAEMGVGLPMGGGVNAGWRFDDYLGRLNFFTTVKAFVFCYTTCFIVALHCLIQGGDSPVVGEPTPYKAVWNDYTARH